MKQLIIAAVMMITGLSVHGRDQETKNGNNIRFYDQNHFLIEGIAFADSVRESPYDGFRFP